MCRLPPLAQRGRRWDGGTGLSRSWHLKNVCGIDQTASGAPDGAQELQKVIWRCEQRPGSAPCLPTLPLGFVGELHGHAFLPTLTLSLQEPLFSSLFASFPPFPPFLSPERVYMASQRLERPSLLGTRQTFPLLLSVCVRQGCIWTGLLGTCEPDGCLYRDLSGAGGR